MNSDWEFLSSAGLEHLGEVYVTLVSVSYESVSESEWEMEDDWSDHSDSDDDSHLDDDLGIGSCAELGEGRDCVVCEGTVLDVSSTWVKGQTATVRGRAERHVEVR